MENRFKFRFWNNSTAKMLDVYNFTDFFICVAKPDNTGLDYFLFANCFLMQCTGLKDKNGKLIYESDILESINSGEKYVIRFEGCRLIAAGLDNSYELWEVQHRNFEVIGNIYENSELLEHEKKAKNAHLWT